MTQIVKVLNHYGDDIVELMKQKLQQDRKVATGELINTMDSYVEEEDGKAFLYVDVASYGRYVDEGRKPNSKWPPVKAIRDWVKIKGIRPRNNQTEEQTIFLIRRAIGIRGIPAAPFLDIWDLHINELEELIEDAAVEDFSSIIHNYIDKFNKK